MNAFYYLLVDPLTVAIPICAISDFIFGEKDKKLLILAVVLTVVKTIANTTRSTLGILIVYFAVGSMMFIKINGYDVGLRKFIKKGKTNTLCLHCSGCSICLYDNCKRV